MASKRVSKRKCPRCKTFNPPGSFITGPGGLQAFCNIDCMSKHAYSKRSKGYEKQRKENKKKLAERKESLKTNSDWAREAQTAVNLYVRIRDRGRLCISCDKPDVGKRDASHYRSVGACKQLRFNTFNIWASCHKCNTQLSGNLLEYRIRLVPKLGAARVDWLESQNEIARYSIDYLKRVKSIFNRRAKHLIKLRGY